MTISENLRAKDADYGRIFYENQEFIEQLYAEALSIAIDLKEEGDESFGTICAMMVTTMLNDLASIPVPFVGEYEDEDQELIGIIGEALGIYLTFEAMCKKDMAIRDISANGSPSYRIIEKKTKKTRKASK